MTALAFLLGCGGDETASSATEDPEEAPAAPPSLLPADELMALPMTELEAYIDALPETGPEAAWRKAVAVRIRALRTPDEEDALLAKAESLFLRSLEDRGALGCRASLDYAAFAARDQRELEKAFAIAYRALRRYDAEAHPDCVRRARRIVASLRTFRPPAEVLAAIERDPHAISDEPSADPPAFETLAEARAGATDTVLEAVSVFGSTRGDEAGSTRAVLHLQGVSAYRSGLIEAEAGLPRRFFVDLPQTEIGNDVSRVHPVASRLVDQIRVGLFQPGVTRVVFDLTEDVTPSAFLLTDPYRIVIDIAAERHTEPSRLRVIVLDPGHGGDEFGARHNGLRESTLTLDIAQRCATALEERLPSSRVVLTRRNDAVVSLEERVAFANSVRGDVFVSIHLNGWEEQLGRGGATTFVLDITNDEQLMRLAARENGTSVAEVSDLQRLLAGLHREEQGSGSRLLAEHVHRGTLAGARRILPELPDRGVRSAMFYVLVGAQMPAVLVEASFLTQEDENRALGTVAYRQALADGIAEGIAQYSQALGDEEASNPR
ncbi:MAG: N-acetylmuramoyl-L-alanine amidase [Myxococcota bacterium]